MNEVWHILATWKLDDPQGRICIVKAQGLMAAIQVREGFGFKILDDDIDPSLWRIQDNELVAVEPYPITEPENVP